MSRPRYYWFNFIQKLMCRYPDDLLDDKTEKSREAYDAITDALDELEDDIDGASKIMMLKMVYFDQTHTLEGAAMVLCVSHRTAQNWSSEFVYNVASKIGYL